MKLIEPTLKDIKRELKHEFNKSGINDKKLLNALFLVIKRNRLYYKLLLKKYENNFPNKGV